MISSKIKVEPGKKVFWATPDGVAMSGLYHPALKLKGFVWVLLHGLGSTKEEWLEDKLLDVMRERTDLLHKVEEWEKISESWHYCLLINIPVSGCRICANLRLADRRA